MFDSAIAQAQPTWFSLWRELLAQRGPRLLAVELIITLIGVMLALPLLLAGVIRDMQVAAVALALSAVAGSFLTAWAWSAALAILSEDQSDDSPRVTVGLALRAGLHGGGLRGVLRLWAWLALLQVFSLPGLLIYLDIDLAMAYIRSPFSTLLRGLSWYVAFATALLPMAILLERRGIGRAWRLTHTKLSTVIGIVALLAFGLTTDWLIDELPSRLAETISSIAIGIPLSVLTTAGYYAIYLAHTATSPDGNPAPLSNEDNVARTEPSV